MWTWTENKSSNGTTYLRLCFKLPCTVLSKVGYILQINIFMLISFPELWSVDHIGSMFQDAKKLYSIVGPGTSTVNCLCFHVHTRTVGCSDLVLFSIL